MENRVVAHLDMDAFYVSCELRRHPELRGRPVIVAGDGPRSVVTTASYEARRYGVGSAMPAWRARRLCPQGVFLTPDFNCYRDASREVMGIVRAHVDAVEVVGLDEAYLELTGMPAPKAAMRGIVHEIRGTSGLHASVGVGPNKLVAKMASDAEKPDGFVMLTQQQAQARFGAAPPQLIPGIGEKTAARLAALGIHSIGQLADTPAEVLRAAFAPRTVAHLRALARFEHEGAVSEQRKVVSESRERTFDTDVVAPPELERILGRLAHGLCEALEGQQRQGRTVGIKVRLADFSTHTRARTLSAPVSAEAQVLPVAKDLLGEFLADHAGRPVRLLGVRVAGLERTREDAQLALAL
ncbi:MAG: DNA polymerase IV [Solirubrobacterales bacterium]|nr:DNA polymerase IV [Solirubrobacterales bacterium]